MKSHLFLMLCMTFSFKVFSKTVLMPRPFLSPEVQLIQPDAESRPLVISQSSPYHGARSLNRAVKVKITSDFNLDQTFSIKLSGINRGPWNRYVNAAIINEQGVKIGFPLRKSDLVAKGLSEPYLDIWLQFKKICEVEKCDFNEGVNLYFFLDDFLGREVKPIYEWDHIVGVYYIFKK